MSDSERIVGEVAERVRALIAEAEERAAEIVRGAEAEAGRIRERAENEASARLDEVRRSLDDLRGRLGGPGGGSPEVEPGPAVVPEPEPPPPEPAPPVPEPEPGVVPEPEPPPDEATPPSAGDGATPPDEAGARLVAMNMALEGAERGAIVAAVGGRFGLDDPGPLVDDVIARAGG